MGFLLLLRLRSQQAYTPGGSLRCTHRLSEWVLRGPECRILPLGGQNGDGLRHSIACSARRRCALAVRPRRIGDHSWDLVDVHMG